MSGGYRQKFAALSSLEVQDLLVQQSEGTTFVGWLPFLWLSTADLFSDSCLSNNSNDKQKRTTILV
jgi:hypothetical protein